MHASQTQASAAGSRLRFFCALVGAHCGQWIPHCPHDAHFRSPQTSGAAVWRVPRCGCETHSRPPGQRQQGALHVSGSASTTTESSLAHALGRERYVEISCADIAARNVGDVSLQKGQRTSCPAASAIRCMHVLHAHALGQHGRAHIVASAISSTQMAHCFTIRTACVEGAAEDMDNLDLT